MKQKHKFFDIYTLLLLLILAAAIWLRWEFIRRINPYPDEFVTLLAMDMIRQKGAPVLPSGLFYDHGLLYSYAAALVSMLGDPLLLGRLTSLLFGATTIVLTYVFGRRWVSPAVGLLAAAGLAFSPAAIEWSGRVRMYALLQLLVLLVVGWMLSGLLNKNAKQSWAAVGAYFGSLLTQFAAIALLPPLALAEMAALQLRQRQGEKRWFADPVFWVRGAAVGGAAIIAFLLKRAGQPKGVAPLQETGVMTGIWQVLQIYGNLSLNISQSWHAISPFFTQSTAQLYSLFALVAAIWAIVALRKNKQLMNNTPVIVAGFLSIVLALTTVEMLLFVSDDRRDDKYLFMLLPALTLLGSMGAAQIGRRLRRAMGAAVPAWLPAAAAIVAVGAYSGSSIIDIFADTGEDYRAAFAYVAEHRQPDDAILSGTPAAAYYYLGGNDFYAVQATDQNGYGYRLLPGEFGPVERWLASPVIDSHAALNQTLSGQQVWLVLERWGLTQTYYSPFFMQDMLAQTEFIREDNGIIVLKSLPNPRLLAAEPAVAVDALLHGAEGDSGQAKALGYTLQGGRLTLYWQAQQSMAFDYTVFVNVQNQAGETVLQTDHRPLGSVYPTTLWPVGDVIRETSSLSLAPGTYRLRVGMYLLETGERMWVPTDETLQNMVDLGEVIVP